MIKEFNLKNKKITIYNNDNNQNKPIIIYNSFEGNALELWNKCLEIKCQPFILVVIDNINWDDEMTPWETPSLFKGEVGSKGIADQYLLFLEQDLIPIIQREYKPECYILAGYSLGGLFTIYSIYKTLIFSRFVSCSGSLWYPQFLDYALKTKIKTLPTKVYFSLGDKEKNTHNLVDSVVEDNILKIYNKLKENNIDTIFELNPGGHFKDVYLRIAKGIKWILE